MKKTTSGEAVLSACQIQAVRMNNLENRRMQHHVHLLQDDLRSELGRLQRQAQGLRYHFTNVVRVIKPNRAYQTWKQAHAKEIAADRTDEFIQTMKSKARPKLKTRASMMSTSSTVGLPATTTRPLLLLIDEQVDPDREPVIDFQQTFLRPTTSPMKPAGVTTPSNSQRSNPLLNILMEKSIGEKSTIRREKTFTSNSNGTSLPRIDAKGAKLDTLYRYALQNQTAYQAVDQTRIDSRKTYDREFASRHRAMKGSVRAASVLNQD